MILVQFPDDVYKKALFAPLHHSSHAAMVVVGLSVLFAASAPPASVAKLVASCIMITWVSRSWCLLLAVIFQKFVAHVRARTTRASAP
jgi:hypothetical protein